MASLLGRPLGDLLQQVNNISLDQDGWLTSQLNVAWRLMILLNRATSPMAKVPSDILNVNTKISTVVNKHYAKPGSFSIMQRTDPWLGPFIIGKESGMSPDDVKKLLRKDMAAKSPLPTDRTEKNDIIIINQNTKPYMGLVIQNRPDELSFEPQSTWASIRSIGRNNPFHIYTGGEDTISFDISWYSDSESREDVLIKCKLLESWTRADGYRSSPPTLQILWGKSGIFDKELFVLTSAHYTLSHFQNSSSKVEEKKYLVNDINGGPGEARSMNLRTYQDLKLLPNCATQQLIFKKVTVNNTTHEDILGGRSLNGILTGTTQQ